MMKRLLFGLLIITIVGLVWIFGFGNSPPDDAFSLNLVGDSVISDGFSRAEGPHTWDFPADYGAHPEYQTEWWYYTGNLETTEGRRFGYQLTFFRRGLNPPQDWEKRDSVWGGNQVYMGHFALSDIVAETHYDFERFSRGAASLSGTLSEPFEVWLENWEVVQTSDKKWRMQAEQDGVRLDLVLNDQKGIIFHGEEGYSQRGPEAGNASYYFSQTRLASDGLVTINGERFPVTGWSWMDHEFSTSALSSGQVGWDWFSLQLDDGSDLMMFQIRRDDGSIDPFSSGTVITPEGETIKLDRDQFEIQVTNTWQSPHSGATYPATWTIRIQSINLILEVQPYMADQEMNVSYAYWEGAVGVSGMKGEQTITGSGYIEMTGYAASMEGEF